MPLWLYLALGFTGYLALVLVIAKCIYSGGDHDDIS